METTTLLAPEKVQLPTSKHTPKTVSFHPKTTWKRLKSDTNSCLEDYLVKLDSYVSILEDKRLNFEKDSYIKKQLNILSYLISALKTERSYSKQIEIRGLLDKILEDLANDKVSDPHDELFISAAYSAPDLSAPDFKKIVYSTGLSFKN